MSSENTTADQQSNSTVDCVVCKDPASWFNQQQSQIYLPSLIFLPIFACVGTIGNVAVAIVYVQKKKTSASVYILALAAVDLVTCAILIPLDITASVLQYAYPSDFLCRLIPFLTHTLSVYSVVLLLSIAVERYLAVHRPVAFATTIPRSKVVVSVGAVASAVICCPLLTVYQLTHKANVGWNVYVCSFKDGSEGLISTYSYMLIGVTLAASLVITALYVRTFRSIVGRAHRKPVIKITATSSQTIWGKKSRLGDILRISSRRKTGDTLCEKAQSIAAVSMSELAVPEEGHYRCRSDSPSTSGYETSTVDSPNQDDRGLASGSGDQPIQGLSPPTKAPDTKDSTAGKYERKSDTNFYTSKIELASRESSTVTLNGEEGTNSRGARSTAESRIQAKWKRQGNRMAKIFMLL
ncbi:PREDICTED: neuropeptide CCHamide-1 receptor-like [Branchiostoma belcheri]|uniref:Neuropeptide CCHamide-1 receptor-like n=1 Tax=Branchiostoma belcheri TaxID=7741 RepID=A0A6P4ZES4_BRABE|nr:PREDICTED: neuropeptide CCHamide-1 receptor-like [Branchiostoma belcheri]